MSNNFGSNNYGQPNLGFGGQPLQQQPQQQFMQQGGGQNPSPYPQMNQMYPTVPGSSPYPNQATGANLPYPISPMGPGGGTQGFNQPYPSSSPGYPPAPSAFGGNMTNPSGFNAPYPSTASSGMSNPGGFGAPYPSTASSEMSNPGGFGAPYPPASSGNMTTPSGFDSPYPPSRSTGAISNPSAGYTPPNSGYGSPYPTSSAYGQGPPETPASYNPASSNLTSGYPSLGATGQTGYSQGSSYGGCPPAAGTQPYGSSMLQSGYPGSSSLLFQQDRATVRPSTTFDPLSDCTVLRKAMKGMGTDEKAIINVLGRRTSTQRQQIVLTYQQSYGKDLLKDLKNELSGTFEQVILALMTSLPMYLASELHKSMKGLGTKESVLIEVLCTQDNNMIRTIKTAYQQAYKRPLEKDIQDDTSGDFKRLLISVCAGARQEGEGDPAMAQKLAHDLYKAGQGRWGTNDSEFNRIMAAYSRNQLRLVFAEYRKIKGCSFEDAIKSELSGEFKTSMLALYDSIESRPAYFAKKLHEAMAGMGTRDDALIRLIVSRCEIDLGSIKEQYQLLYKKSLESAVSSETSGDYKRILLVLLQD